MSKLFFEGSIEGGRCVVEVLAEGRKTPLNMRLDIARHSPTGFAWGYSGSGPAQLALAILCYQLKACPEDRWLAARIGDKPASVEADVLALRCHQAFKFACVARLDGRRGWRLSDSDVRKTLREMAGLDPAPQQALPGVA